ncbi:hypothetical protein ABPG77_007830 [Micractinium sp. CCAP 211/92]
MLSVRVRDARCAAPPPCHSYAYFSANPNGSRARALKCLRLASEHLDKASLQPIACGMSGLQLGRLGRRLLSLGQQVERPWASAALQQFSSTAEAAAGSGIAAGEGPSSSGAQRAPPSGSSAAGQGAFRRGQQQRPEGGSRRQPGAMSQLLASEGKRRGGRPGGGPDGGRPPRPDALAPRTNDPEDCSIYPAAAPPELREVLSRSPAELVLGEFGLSLRLATGRGDETVDLKDVVTDIADIADMDQLPLLKYYMTNQQWLDLTSGRMDEEDQNHLLDRLAAAMLTSPTKRAKEERVQAAKANDPDYDLEASLGSAPALRGSPRPKAPKAAELAAELEAQKEQIMQQMKLTEDEFEAAKQATAQQAAAAARAAATPVLPDYLKLERRLRALLDRGLPRDHPNYEAAAQQLAVVQGNPGWPHERKMVFAKRLIKQMASSDMVA